MSSDSLRVKEDSIKWARAFAQAFSEQKLAMAFKEVDDVNFSLEDHVSFLQKVVIEADRSAAILLYSYFDDFLMACFKRQLGSNADELFGPNRSLSASRPRIILAEGLGWLSPDVVQTLDIMRKVRNEFAHKITVDSFKDNRMRGWIASMSPFERMIYKEDSYLNCLKPLEKLSPRELFLSRSIFAITESFRQLLLHPLLVKKDLGSFYRSTEFGSKLPKHHKLLMVSGLYVIYSLLTTDDPEVSDSRLALWRRVASEGFKDWLAEFDRLVDQGIDESP